MRFTGSPGPDPDSKDESDFNGTHNANDGQYHSQGSRHRPFALVVQALGPYYEAEYSEDLRLDLQSYVVVGDDVVDA